MCVCVCARRGKGGKETAAKELRNITEQEEEKEDEGEEKEKEQECKTDTISREKVLQRPREIQSYPKR